MKLPFSAFGYVAARGARFVVPRAPQRVVHLCAAHSDNMRNLVEFLMEAVLMADFHHRNVMWLIAIMIDNDMKPHVLLPLMEHGDLRTFIAKPTNVRSLVWAYVTVKPLYKSQTPLHGHQLRTPAWDTTNGQAHNNSTTNLPHRNARAQHLDMSRCCNVVCVANFCPLVVFVGGVRSWCS